MPGDEDQSLSNGLASGDALESARALISSPAIIAQDEPSKRRFLESRNLSPSDVNQLLLETRPTRMPSVPPRTYPALPPSRLPNLIAGILRLFSVLVGSAGVLALLYSRFILPRITRTSEARRSLRQHQLSLVKRLHTAIATAKTQHKEQLEILPRVYPDEEDPLFRPSSSLNELKKFIEKENASLENLPFISLLRCALHDLEPDAEGSTTEDLLKAIQASFPEVPLDDDILQHYLETSHCFHSTPSETSQTRWKYIPLQQGAESSLTQSLSNLKQALPSASAQTASATQHTLQGLYEFTGYLSSHIYVPYRPRAVGSQQNSTQEEELKKEIRALKGLVLNRRTFMQRP